MAAATRPAPKGAPAGGDSLFAHLPNEILSAIFAHIAPRPLILILSVVCRRWRTLALRLYTTTELGTEEPHHLARLPCITDLDLSRAFQSVPLPTTLRRLAISTTARFEAVHVPDSIRLEALEMPYNFEEQDEMPPSRVLCSVAVLAHSRTSLTELAILLGNDTPNALILALHSTHFPALRTLSVFARTAAAPLGPFMERHAPQLTKLILAMDPPSLYDPILAPAAGRLTALRYLSIANTDYFNDDGEALRRLVAMAPPTADLNLPLTLPTFIAPLGLTSLTELSVTGEGAFDSLTADAIPTLRASTPRLRTLGAITYARHNSDTLLQVLRDLSWHTLVTSLELHHLSSGEILEALQACPNVAQVAFYSVDIDKVTAVVKKLTRPHVITHLRMNNRMARHSIDEVITLWTLALKRLRLHTLALSVGATPARDKMVELRKLVLRSAVQGVAVVQLSLSTDVRQQISTEWLRVSRLD